MRLSASLYVFYSFLIFFGSLLCFFLVKSMKFFVFLDYFNEHLGFTEIFLCFLIFPVIWAKFLCFHNLFIFSYDFIKFPKVFQYFLCFSFFLHLFKLHQNFYDFFVLSNVSTMFWGQIFHGQIHFFSSDFYLFHKSLKKPTCNEILQKFWVIAKKFPLNFI